MTLKELNKLIDAAAANCGSSYKLAQTIHVPNGNLSAWRSGAKKVPVGDIALMAELAGLNVVDVTNQAILDRYVDTPKADLVRSALSLEKRSKPRKPKA